MAPACPWIAPIITTRSRFFFRPESPTVVCRTQGCHDRARVQLTNNKGPQANRYMSESTKKPAVEAQILSLKTFVTGLRTGADQIDLGVKGKAAFAALDAIVEEVEAINGTPIDLTLITGSTITKGALNDEMSGEIERRATGLQQTVIAACEGLSSAAQEYAQQLQSSFEEKHSDAGEDDTASADEISAMAKGAIAMSIAQQGELFGALVESALGYVVSSRLLAISDAMRSKA